MSIGTGALTHTQQATANFKVAYDLSSTVRATYSPASGTTCRIPVPSLIRGQPAARRLSAASAGSSFAGNRYAWNQTQMSNAVSLKSDSRGLYDFDLSASSYNYLQDTQLSPIHRHGYRPWLLAERQDHPQRRHELAERRRQVDLATIRFRRASGNQLRRSRRPLLSSTTQSTALRPGITPSTGNGQIFSDGIGETQHRRALVSRRLEDRSECEADVRRTARGPGAPSTASTSTTTQTEHSSLTRVTLRSAVAINQPELKSSEFLAENVVVLRS